MSIITNNHQVMFRGNLPEVKTPGKAKGSYVTIDKKTAVDMLQTLKGCIESKKNDVGQVFADSTPEVAERDIKGFMDYFSDSCQKLIALLNGNATVADDPRPEFASLSIKSPNYPSQFVFAANNLDLVV